MQRHWLVERCHTRLIWNLSLHHVGTSDALHHCCEVFRRGAATAAHQRQAIFGHEPFMGIGQLFRPERIAGAVGGEFR